MMKFLFGFIVAWLVFSNANNEKEAMRICQMKHTYETCFQGLMK
jgi:hypothetical protein